MVGQGPAVLAAGTGWIFFQLICVWEGGYFLLLTGFYEEMKRCFFFLIFSSPGRSPGKAIALLPVSALAFAAASALAKC